jgi:hypothetical protein
MAAVKAEQLTVLIQKRLKEDEATDRNALQLAGLGKYMNIKKWARVGEGKDALGNPLPVEGESGGGVEEGEIMDDED